MKLGIGNARVRTSATFLGMFGIVGLGLWLRLVDPLSSPVIPAEDPYTHMAIVREHLRTGQLEPLTVGAGLYPPGLHAVLAAVWAFGGGDLYEMIRLGPAVFGAIGILGVGLLLWRHAGAVAALLGSLAVAVAPEAIFRTTMMSPTAQDLAVAPFLILALMEVVAGRLAWAAVAAPTALFLVFSHPWLFAILAMATAVTVLLAYLLPGGADPRVRATAVGAAGAVAIVGGGLGLTLTSCGGYCGRGWVDIFPALTGYSWLAWALLVLAFAPLLILLVRPGIVGRRRLHPRRQPWPVPVRIGMALLLAVAALVTTWVAVRQGMPPYVDLPRMMGWPILSLAAAGFVLLPFLPGRLAHAAGGLVAATYPFVVFNPLDSPFWSHRTVAFLGLGLVLLVGLTGAALVRWGTSLATSRRAAATGGRAGGVRRFRAVVAASLVMTVCVGSVYAGTPDGYAGGWYRLYPPCEMDALREVAGLADAAPAAVVIVGGWQPKLVLSALTHDSYRIWYAAAFYTDSAKRDDITINLAHQGRPVYVVVDRYLATDYPESFGFLDSPSWEPLGSWCAGQGTGEPRVQVYRWDDGA